MTTENLHSTTPTWANRWVPDDLGFPFEKLTIDLGEDPDGEPSLCGTLVRCNPAVSSAPALVWVHGNSDYFIHRHVAKHFTELGYAFYAIDLRKCGRSYRDGQRGHHVSSLSLYDVELSACLDFLHQVGHPTVSFIAHSTAGLTVPLWLDDLRRNHPIQHSWVGVLVLNSPWFELPLTGWRLHAAKQLARILGRVAPSRLVPAHSTGGYGMSLHRQFHGEWDYNLAWKPHSGFPRSWQWLSAIVRAQDKLRHGIEIGVPCLVLHSDSSLVGNPYSPALDRSDAVLNVDDIAAGAHHLGSRIQRKIIQGARHDVFLSQPQPLTEAFRVTEEFLAATIGTHG